MGTSLKIKGLLDFDRSIQPRLAETLQPLKLFGISNFGYSKITKDKRILRIGNYAPQAEHFFINKVYNQRDCYRGYASENTFKLPTQTKIFLWNENGNKPTLNRKLLNMWNGISFYHIHQDYLETWAIGGGLNDTGLTDFYINNLSLLNRFFLYFKGKFKDILEITDPAKTLDIQFHETDIDIYTIDKKTLEKFNQKIFQNKYLLSNGKNNFCLSLRELECLSLKNKGYSAKEMGKILKISNRTIETYIENIKLKSGFQNIQQVLSFCKNEGII